MLSFVIYVFVLFEWKEMFLDWDMYFDWYQCEFAVFDIAWLCVGIFYLLAYQVVVLDEVRLSHVSNIRNFLEHSEKIPQPPFPTYKLDNDKTLMQTFNKNQTEIMFTKILLRRRSKRYSTYKLYICHFFRIYRNLNFRSRQLYYY